MKSDNLQSLMIHAMESASKIFEARKSEGKDVTLMPVFLCVTPAGTVPVAAPTMNGTPSQKAQTADMVRAFCEQASVSRLAFVVEGWSLPKELMQTYNPETDLPPSQHPARIEVIHVLGEDMNGETGVAMRQIIRRDGQVSLGDMALEISRSAWNEGRMANFLPRAAAGRA